MEVDVLAVLCKDALDPRLRVTAADTQASAVRSNKGRQAGIRSEKRSVGTRRRIAVRRTSRSIFESRTSLSAFSARMLALPLSSAPIIEPAEPAIPPGSSGARYAR